MPTSEGPHHLEVNCAVSNSNAADYVADGRSAWSSEPRWGLWKIPERDVGLFPHDVDGSLTVELGCGTGYVSTSLRRRGAHPIGLDNSPAQLASAAAFQREFDHDQAAVRDASL